MQIIKMLHLSGETINNGSKEETLVETRAYGYDEARMNEGKQLRDSAIALDIRQRNKVIDFRHARSRVREVFDKVKEEYYKHLTIARVVLKKDKSSLAKLEAKGARKYALGSWIQQAKVFYKNALNSKEIMQQLNTMRLNRKMLKEGLGLLEELETVVAEKEECAGNASQATTERDQAIADLKDWLVKFRTIACIVFGKKSPHLTRLGFKTPRKHQEEPDAEPGEEKPALEPAQENPGLEPVEYFVALPVEKDRSASPTKEKPKPT